MSLIKTFDKNLEHWKNSKIQGLQNLCAVWWKNNLNIDLNIDHFKNNVVGKTIINEQKYVTFYMKLKHHIPHTKCDSPQY